MELNLIVSGAAYTVEQQIFACRKFSRISRIFGNSRKFPAREYYHFKAEKVSLPKIRENFLHANCLWSKFAKISCRENFLFYSISQLLVIDSSHSYLHSPEEVASGPRILCWVMFFHNLSLASLNGLVL